jgi:hypothetical protein
MWRMPYDSRHQLLSGDIAILAAARDRIADRDHWGQFRPREGERFCIVAALAWASRRGNPDDAGETERRLHKLLVAQLPRTAALRARMTFIAPRYRLMIFNDCLRTYHDDVVELFDNVVRQLVSQSTQSGKNSKDMREA